MVKLVVYSLLLINFALYIRDDIIIAAHTMRNGGSFLDWTAAFATSIDETAWILLLLLFELETYVLSDEPLSRPKAFVMHGIRIICYTSLAHTVYAYGVAIFDLHQVTPIAEINNLCQLVGTDSSFATNLHYTLLDAKNCMVLSTSTQFFYIDPPANIIITDIPGLVIEQQLAFFDIVDAVTWLLIVLTIEVTVWLQDRGIGNGPIISFLNKSKILLYSILWIGMSYWVYRGHYMFAWDEFVWIVGFVAIEMNVVEWRNELVDTNKSTLASTPT